MDTACYVARRAAASRFVPLRGLRCHLQVWGEDDGVAPPLVLLHGWMDVGASFQFVVDALRRERFIVAPDWRGYGRTEGPVTDTFWFPDYLADLDALLDGLAPGRAVDLVGHSMGGNVAMLYAGVRPARVRRLVNLEGFGLPDSAPQQAPGRLRQWLEELRQPARLRSYDSREAVAARLRANNPLLAPDKALWLAGHWAEQRADGRWHLRADAAHKHVNPVLYRKDEALACWREIEAPVLWVEGDRTDLARWWGSRYTRDEFEARLSVVARLERRLLSPCGHMLHHDQPEALAAELERFLA